MLLSVQSRIPELYAYCRSAIHTVLSFYLLRRRHPARRAVIFTTELNLGYTDDVTLGSSVENVASDVAEIIRAC